MTTNPVIEQAKAEIAAEEHRKAVDAMKVYLLTKKSFFTRFFPWKISITRRAK